MSVLVLEGQGLRAAVVIQGPQVPLALDQGAQRSDQERGPHHRRANDKPEHGPIAGAKHPVTGTTWLTLRLHTATIRLEQGSRQSTGPQLGHKKRRRTQSCVGPFTALGGDHCGVLVEAGGPDGLPEGQEDHKEQRVPHVRAQHVEENTHCRHPRAVFDHGEGADLLSVRADDRHQHNDHCGVHRVHGAIRGTAAQGPHHVLGQGAVQMPENQPDSRK
mmetsp:Transcript_80934/g.142746  ORF Transcript_80934/g.142746 Transcript_80934/m.142746 type:complete len:218 (+) Transcript_80934:185-838(+)